MRKTVRWVKGSVFASVLLAGMFSVSACGDDAEATDTDTTADTADTTDTGSPDVADTADTAVPDAADTTPDSTATDTLEPDVADTSPSDTATVTRFSDIHQIFINTCGTCHTGATASSGSGGHALGAADVAVAYQASQKTANIAKCSGKTVGECALIRIKDGSMPASGDCNQTPKGPKCPTEEMQALIQAWIDDGQLQ
jgi:mono/diheme cytochrome c family protein